MACSRWFPCVLMVGLLCSACSAAEDGDAAVPPVAEADANAPDANDMAAAAFDDTGFLVGDGQSLLPERKGGYYITPIQPASAERIRRLKVPEGFQVNVWARSMGKIRMMAVGPDGTVYVTRPSRGDVLALRDVDNDGQAEPARTALKLPKVHGIYIHEGRKMYLATVGEAFAAEMDGNRLARPKKIVTGLPTASGHHNRTLAIGPDGRLYITVGSTCNCCWEKNPENATMLVADANGSNRKIFAMGLRNTIGFGWHPETGQLWGMDHGIDWLGPNFPPEELNRIEAGKHYGWPWVTGDRQPIPLEKHEAVGKLADFARKTTPPVLGHQAHSSPLMMVFYTGEQFPDEYVNDAFVAFRGSWNRNQPVGYKVARVRFDEAGQPVAFEDFLTGFLVRDAAKPYAFGRPVGLAVLPDGSLLVGDDNNGMIYRVRYDAKDQPPDRP